MCRSMVITVYQDSGSCPLKGLAIKQATEFGVREATQAIMPVQATLMIVDMLDQILRGKGTRTSYDKVASYLKSQEWAPKEGSSSRFICSAMKFRQLLIQKEGVYLYLKRMHF